MAAHMRNIGKVLRGVTSPLFLSVLQHKSCLQKFPVRSWTPAGSAFMPPSHSFFMAPPVEDERKVVDALPRYKESPWEYLESEEYIERYGTNPVWTGYRRNHKGGIPPQKTRKTCIRGDKICGNACPICRDPNVIIHHQNLKLLQQFINPYTGNVYDPTWTGICMKQQKVLNKAVQTAQSHGLLPFQIPHMKFTVEDYSNSHDAVGFTPPPPSLTYGDVWYTWYGTIKPDEKEVAKVKKIYKAYLK